MAADVTVVVRGCGINTVLTFNGVDSWEEEDRFLTFYDEEDSSLGLVLAEDIRYMFVNDAATESFRTYEE